MDTSISELYDDDDTISLISSISSSTSSLTNDDAYEINFGKKIQRIGKIYSFTFWRTMVQGEIFWSIQGNNPDGSGWILTKYFGPNEHESKRYQQEIILHHPIEKQIKMYYMSSLRDGQNSIKISKHILQHFKDDKNNFKFEFRLLKIRKRKRLYTKAAIF